MTKEEFAALMAEWLADNGGAYNMAHTGQEIDDAVGAVAGKTTVIVAPSEPGTMAKNTICLIEEG